MNDGSPEKSRPEAGEVHQAFRFSRLTNVRVKLLRPIGKGAWGRAMRPR